MKRYSKWLIGREPEWPMDALILFNPLGVAGILISKSLERFDKKPL